MKPLGADSEIICKTKKENPLCPSGMLSMIVSEWRWGHHV
jgi:hypothetical protein